MDYNQLKIRVLLVLKSSKELPSEQVRSMLSMSKVNLSDKAVKMALMRYTRQGLLSRGKKDGHYHYQLTEKGRGRLDWLSKSK